MIDNEIALPAAALEVPAVVDSVEAQLVDEVGNLWQVHSQAQASLSKTRDELKRIRIDLSRRLHELKSVLSRPGRGGAWSRFLHTQKIPRSTADRLARAHDKTISADRDSCTTEQIKEPTEVVVCRYVHALWPRLSKTLTTRDSVQVFIVELQRMAEKSFADNSLLDSSPVKSTDGPSYLRRLNLPLSEVLDNAAFA